jgi:serine/threonine protein kinase
MPGPKKVFETARTTYTAQGVIGDGGAGIVYLVTDADGTEFALKCLREPTSAKRKRFTNELFFCQQDVHENIVRVVDSGVFVDGEHILPFYVMRRYAGTLRKLMSAKLAPDQVLPLFDQILSGVEAAHLRGVYHRDLKPENILYDPAGKRLVVADFGIAHFGEDELLTAVETKNQERLANFIYAAPEQKIRDGRVDHRADIFALGLMVNEMFTAVVPLAARHPLIASISPSHGYLDQIVSRMILHSAADRYETITKIKEELVGRTNLHCVTET